MAGVLLVGATDGIGLELARLYARDGWNVGVVGRDDVRLELTRDSLSRASTGAKLVLVRCNVKHRDAIQAAFDGAVREMGGLDLIVYCAGVFHSASGHALCGNHELDTVDVNLNGFISFASAATNYFVDGARDGRKQNGHIAVIGSVAGERGRKGNPAYCASKAAVDTYCEGLRARLFPLGISVTNVKPGFVNTKMLGGRARPGMIEADDAAIKIKRGLDRRRDVFFVPSWWGVVGFILKVMPRFIFKRLAPG